MACQRGFSLLEVVVALAILGLLLVTLADSVRGGLLSGAKAASVVMMFVTAFGVASTTVHGICCPCSLKIWVMPSFFPMIPIISTRP